MRLSREDYRKAVGLLKRFNYNCLTIMNIRNDILSISAIPISDMPRVPYGVGNTTLAKVIEMEENEQLQTSLKECKIVSQALQLVSDDSRLVFEEIYRKGNTKWGIMNSGMSESTYFRRKRELINAVDKEIKKYF